MQDNIGDLTKIKTALQVFIDHNQQDYELLVMLDNNTWHTFNMTSTKANALRQMLFELRRRLNSLPEMPGLHACKLAVHKKLIDIAYKYPLNARSSSGKIFCPISMKDVSTSDVILSNGYTYDWNSLLNALSSLTSSPRLENISKQDVALIHEINRDSKTEILNLYTAQAAVFGFACATFLIICITSAGFFPIALPIFGFYGVMGMTMAGGLVGGLITSIVTNRIANSSLFNSRKEQRITERLEALLPSNSTTHVLRVVASNDRGIHENSQSNEAVPLLDASPVNSSIINPPEPAIILQPTSLRPIGPGSYQ